MIRKIKISIIFAIVFLFSCSDIAPEKSHNKGEEISNKNRKEKIDLEKDSVNRRSIFLDGYDSFPIEIFNQDSLRVIKFNNSNINEIPKEVRRLKKVEKIIISNSSIFPKGLEYFPNLSHLDLVKNDFDDFPKSICKLRQIKFLRIIDSFRSNKLESCFYNLSSLEEVEFAFLNLEKINKEILNLSALKKISFDKTNLNQIPDYLFQLPNLEKLELMHNKLSTSEIQKTRIKCGDSIEFISR